MTWLITIRFSWQWNQKQSRHEGTAVFLVSILGVLRSRNVRSPIRSQAAGIAYCFQEPENAMGMKEPFLLERKKPFCLRRNELPLSTLTAGDLRMWEALCLGGPKLMCCVTFLQKGHLTISWDLGALKVHTISYRATAQWGDGKKGDYSFHGLKNHLSNPKHPYLIWLSVPRFSHLSARWRDYAQHWARATRTRVL